MNRQELEAEIRRTLAALTDTDVTDVSLDEDLSVELGLDSLSRLELLSEVEDRLDMLIYDADTAKATTIRGMIELCEATLAEQREQASCASA